MTTSKDRATPLIRFAGPALLAALAMPGFLFGQAATPAAGVLPAAPADPAIAAALGGIRAENVRADISKLVSFGTRSTLSSMDTGLPPGQGVTAAADWVFAEFTRISQACDGCLDVRRDDFIEPKSTAPGGRIPRDTRIQNIYAVLKGTDPAQAARRVLVTGHYDSRVSDVLDTRTLAPGANDDASGVAVSLESARVLTKMKLPATIVFVAVAGEEQGLNGSRHLAKLARSEGWDLEAVLNNDIVGGDRSPGQRTDTVRVFSEGVPGPATLEQLRAIQTLGAENDSPSRELARAIQEVAQSYSPNGLSLQGAIPQQKIPGFTATLIFRRDRFLRGGDHTSFNAEGFAAVRFTEYQENFNRQHQSPRVENGIVYEDRLEFVDFDYVVKVAKLNAAALATFASAPGEPADVRILTRALDNNTELTWAAPAGAPAGTTYEVVYRPTEAATWIAAAPATPALSIKLPISKDNVIFAVRSVDAAGHRSPAVLPTPLAR